MNVESRLRSIERAAKSREQDNPGPSLSPATEAILDDLKQWRDNHPDPEIRERSVIELLPRDVQERIKAARW